MKLNKIAALLAVAGVATPVFATNGMNMEGYGPVATGMGGASMAYDNGNGGMINNPATLGFMKPGTSRFDIAIGGLHPDVNSSSKDSGARSFFMPAFGYTRRTGDLTWGVGMMAQGGMGTRYSNGGYLGTTRSAVGADNTMMAGAPAPMNSFGYATAAQLSSAMAEGLARENMSEVGVGRLMFPLAYAVNEQFTIGGSIDYVWAGMDLKWTMDGAHFFDMLDGAKATMGAQQRFGRINGSFHDAFMNGFGIGAFRDMAYGYFDFEKDGKFGQKATGSGWAANIGFTYNVNSQLSIGGVYHPKTNLSDLETGRTGATGIFNVATAGGAFPAVFQGKVKVIDFQWPETFGFGLAYQANDRLMIAADYKRINWADVMKSFRMKFTTANDPTGGLVASGSVMNMTFYQNWDDQDVLQIGAQYKYSDALTLRAGGNFSSNPVPKSTVTPLFPAIIEKNYTAGFGYGFDKMSSIDFSMTYAPKVTMTNNWGAVSSMAGMPTSNQRISMSQTNWQLMYSYRY